MRPCPRNNRYLRPQKQSVAAVCDRRTALIEGVNELPGQGVPLLEQEGWLRLHKEASQHFLDGAATPPLRGGEHPVLQFIHSFIERRYSRNPYHRWRRAWRKS